MSLTLMVCALTCSLAPPLCAKEKRAAKPASVGQRILDFPNNPSALADIYVASSSDPIVMPTFRFLAQTKGRIVVPSHACLCLKYTGSKPKELTEMLRTLKPDSLMRMDLNSQPLVTGEVEAIAALTGLRQLDLQDTTLTDDEAKHLSKLTNLTFIAVNKTRVADEVLKSASHMPKLVYLSAEYTNVSDKGVVHLVKLPLETLRLGYTKAGDKSLEEISKLKKLRILAFSGNKVSVPALEKLSKLQALRDFRLCDLKAPLRKDELITIGKLGTLDRLTLSGSKIVVDSLDCLKSLKRLSILELSACSLNDKQLKGGFDSLGKTLGSLDLSSNEITDVTIMRLPIMPALRQIDLSKTRVTEFGLRYLKKQPKLELVKMDFTALGDTAVPVIESFGPQVKFSIQTTKITANNLARLEKVNRLVKATIF